MSIDDRLRAELRERSAQIPVDGAGPAAVAGEAQRRLRRTRIAGVTAAAALLIGVGGTALALRDSGDGADADQVATDDTTQVEAPAEPAAAQPEGEAEEPAASDGPDATGESAETEDAADVVTTEGDDAAEPAGPADDPADSNEADVAEPGSDASGAPAAPAAAAPLAVDMISHGGGYVALRGNGTVWFSPDGASWSSAGDLAGNDGGPSLMASDGSTLVAAGTATTGAGPVAWLSRSDSIGSWTAVDVPLPADDGSDLTRFRVNITGLGVGAAGIVVTGEVLVEVDIAAIVGDDIAATDDWTLGDSTGDLSKVLVYDDATGDVIEEYDLRDLGVPQSTIDVLNNPNHPAYVATGDTSLSIVDSDLADGTVLTDVVIGGGEILAAGWSADFSSRILWSSTDAATWTPVPVSVIPGSRRQPIGVVGNRTVVFSTQGPLLTVQSRGSSGEWSEVRLDREMGSAATGYELVDAAHGPGGIAAIIASVDGAGNETYHLATSTNGRRWEVRELADVVGGSISSATSLAVSGATVVISFDGASGAQVATASLG